MGLLIQSYSIKAGETVGRACENALKPLATHLDAIKSRNTNDSQEHRVSDLEILDAEQDQEHTFVKGFVTH